MNTFFFLIIFLLGLAFGSFASVIIHRLHIQDPYLFSGRSRCPKCATTLGWRDLIPILSYLINQFQCRFCKQPIALRYPLLELAMGGGFLSTAFLVGFENDLWLLFYLYITFTFMVLSFYDFLFQEVPDSLVVPPILIALIVMAGTKAYSLPALVLGIGIPLTFFGTLFLASRGRWLGGGDVRIGVLMGALLGWPTILAGLFLGYLLGAIYSLGGIIIKKFNRKTHIPFAPFLLMGTYIALFWGEKMIQWYLNLG